MQLRVVPADGSCGDLGVVVLITLSLGVSVGVAVWVCKDAYSVIVGLGWSMRVVILVCKDILNYRWFDCKGFVTALFT